MFATTEDFGGTSRIERAADELAALLAGRVARAVEPASEFTPFSELLGRSLP